MRVLVLNGPNLNLLGRREPEIYGRETLADLESRVSEWGARLGCSVESHQTNAEHELVEQVQNSDHEAIVINPGALTHTSRSLADALRSVDIPCVEVHISNIRGREPWRSHSVISEACVRTIYGRGVDGYRYALRHLVNRLAHPFETIQYGPHSENVADLRQGEKGHIALVHGGFWRDEWQRDTMESLALDLTVRGWATWNVEYRRLGHGRAWPSPGHDVLMALDFIAHWSRGASIDAVVGHSAGGYLALWAAPRSSVEVELIVGLASVTNLEKLVAADTHGSGEALQLLTAGAPSAPPAGEVPTLLVHGSQDEHLAADQSRSFADRAGADALYPETGHFQLLDPSRDHWERVIQRLTGQPQAG